MSSYIIAGSSDNLDTVYCQQVANKVKAKYSNIDFRIIIKHPSEWESHLQQVCRIYGFRNKSNPIIYTFDGKMIGDKPAFLRTCNKYFGISEKEMGIGMISTDVNQKIAEQQLAKKKKLQKGQKTMVQIIENKLSQKMKNKLFTYKLTGFQKYIQKGLVFYQREVEDMISSMKFQVEIVKEVSKEEIKEEDIDLVALTQNDQIPVIQEPKSNLHSEKEKDPFLTHQQQDRKSRTSQRMQESIHSKNSHMSQEGAKRSSIKGGISNSLKPQVTQEAPLGYDVVNVKDYIVAQLGNDYCLIFNKKPVILGEMKLIKNEQTQQGLFQKDYSNHHRNVIGHFYSNQPKIKIEDLSERDIEVMSEHQEDNKNKEQQINDKKQDEVNKKTEQIEIKKIDSNIPNEQASQQKRQNPVQENTQNQLKQQVTAQQKQKLQKLNQLNQGQQNIPIQTKLQDQNNQNLKNQSNQIQNNGLQDSLHQFGNKKLRTQIDVRQFQDKKKVRKSSMLPPKEKYIGRNILDRLEQSQADFADPVVHQIDDKMVDFQRPWNQQEVQKTYHTVVSAKAVASIQFKPENPNPMIKIILRKHLNSATINDSSDKPLPIESVILQSLDEIEPISPGSPIGFIRKLVYSHLVCRVFSYETILDLCHQMIAFLGKLEVKLCRFIGYNIILGPEYLMIVPLIDHYDIYNNQKLYLDGLAPLGVLNLPKLKSPFSIQKRQLKNPYQYIKACQGELQMIQNLVEN